MPSFLKRTALVALTFLAAVTSAPRETVVSTELGVLRGVTENGVESFRGIPFAAPPVGNLRWRPPQPATPWNEVRSAAYFGADCDQTPLPYDSAPLRSTLSEDCLYLNIWRPAFPATGAKAPVMVWIHGGGFTTGGASSAVLAGDSFARKGVIMVSANYRLGRFGFFGFPALTRESEGRDMLGNYALMDQLASLQWIRRNIAAFGGDPDNITVFGNSAGGASIHVMLTSPLFRGLFKRAIIQSGGGRSEPAGARAVGIDKPGLPSLETLGLAFARRHGIAGDDAAALARLRALPASAINGGLNMVTYYQPEQAETYGGPALDGRLIVALPEDSYVPGHQAQAALIVGATNADFGLQNTSTKDGLFVQFGASEARARALYDPTGAASVDAVIAAASSDWTMIEPARFVAAQFARQGLPTYAYRFSYVARSMETTWPDGAPHASDIPYAMGTLGGAYGDKAGRKDLQVADTMNSYWANFAKKGDPNGPGLPLWPRYSVAEDQIMDFAPDGRAQAVADPWKARLDLMQSVH
jgi:para-nitrobenzyl esterase